MKKISYEYLIEELGLTPKQIQEIVFEAQQYFGKNLMMIDEALVERRFEEDEFEPFLPFNVQFELELESNYFSTTLSKHTVYQLIYKLN